MILRKAIVLLIMGVSCLYGAGQEAWFPGGNDDPHRRSVPQVRLWVNEDFVANRECWEGTIKAYPNFRSAYYELARMLYEGFDGPVDRVRAKLLFEKAAERGCKQSQKALIVLFENGMDVDAH